MLTKLQRVADQARVDGEDGFTLIELLIVVVIIGILAAIAIPQFSSTKESAYVATMQSDLRNVITAQETYFAQNNGYAGDTADIGFQGSDAVDLTLGVSCDSTCWSAVAEHDQTGSDVDCAVAVDTTAVISGSFSGTIDQSGEVVCNQ